MAQIFLQASCLSWYPTYSQNTDRNSKELSETSVLPYRFLSTSGLLIWINIGHFMLVLWCVFTFFWRQYPTWLLILECISLWIYMYLLLSGVVAARLMVWCRCCICRLVRCGFYYGRWLRNTVIRSTSLLAVSLLQVHTQTHFNLLDFMYSLLTACLNSMLMLLV